MPDHRASWDDVELGEMITLHRGYDLPSGRRRDGVIPVVSSSGITGCHDEAKVQPPGVVTGRYGTLGEVFFLEEPFWPLNTTLYVSHFHDNDERFISYFLQCQELGARDAASAVPGINRNVLHRLPAKRPPLASQRKIAAILSAYDDLIENNRRRIKLLEEMAQRIYREWFVDFRYPGHEGDLLVDSELGPIPRGWTWLRASEALMINPRMVVDRAAIRPFVPMTSVSEHGMHIAPIEERAGASGAKFANGDTLFARITPCLENGKTAYVQCLPDGSVASGSTEFIVLRSRHLSPELTYLLARDERFRSHAIQSMSGATGRQRVREGCFDTFWVATPPQAILDSFERCIRPVFELSNRLVCANSTLRAARDLLLPRLISGEIDVEDLDITMPQAAA
jgi:type I restriction enzyme S subunit